MVANLVIGLGTIAIAALVAAVVGRRRGLDQVEAESDAEVKRLMEAQAARLTLQDREIADLKSQVAALRQQVATLQSELEVERRISLRFRNEAQS